MTGLIPGGWGSVSHDSQGTTKTEQIHGVRVIFFSAITNWEKMIGLIPGGQGSLSHDTQAAFQLILSNGGSEGSPRPPANFFRYI